MLDFFDVSLLFQTDSFHFFEVQVNKCYYGYFLGSLNSVHQLVSCTVRVIVISQSVLYQP